MKKFWILFIVILGFIAISVFSTSLGNEEPQENFPYKIRKSNR